MKRSFLQNSARRTAFVLAMLLLLGGTPVQAAGNTTACKSQQSSMESRVCPLLLPPGNSVTLSAEYLEMRLGLPAGEIAAITITSLPKQSGGRLMLDGVEVQMYDTILRSELDRLCYVQDDSAQQAGAGWFSFIPLCKESTKICATFQIGQQLDTAQRPLVQVSFAAPADRRRSLQRCPACRGRWSTPSSESLPRAAFALQMGNVSTRPMRERREPTALC